MNTKQDWPAVVWYSYQEPKSLTPLILKHAVGNDPEPVPWK
jgi:hypothetical protein